VHAGTPVGVIPERSNKPLLFIAALVAVIVVAASVTAVVVSGHGSSTAKQRVSGVMSLYDSGVAAAGCDTSNSVYSDIAKGTHVSITNETGKVVGFADLDAPVSLGAGECDFVWQAAGVGRAKLYRVTISDRGSVSYTYAEMVANDWNVSTQVGSAGTGAPPPATNPPPKTTPVTSPPSTTPPANNVPAGIVPLSELLPDDLAVASGCAPAPPPAPLPSSVSDLSCTGDRGLPGSTIYAYQFDSHADYVAGLAAYNRAKAVDLTTATPNCPPPAGAIGQVTWNNQLYPTRNDQVIECFTQSSTDTSPTMPTYIWTIPTRYAFVEAVGSPSTTFTQLDTWWTNNAGPFN
jgi:hypothetical protein